jgi:hypothetical protein
MCAVFAACLTACGGGNSDGGSGGGGSDNQSKIESAEGEAAAGASVEQELETGLNAYEGSGGGLWFEVSGGGECSIDGVYLGDQVSLYEENSSTLVSPDGDVAVSTLPVTQIGEGAVQATEAECLQAVVRALGWEE